MDKTEQRKYRKKGIYLLPNLFTTAALFSGFYAIVASMNGRFEAATVAIFIAMVLDGLDGRVARMTNTQSDFGAEYDSLADLVSFGLAPALVMYNWSLSQLGKLGWCAAFIYTAATALRLARFNTQVGKEDKAYFQGLPSPAAAAVVAGFIWFCEDLGIAGSDVQLLSAILTVLIGISMVSNLRYRSFKDLNFQGRVSFITVFFIVLAFVLIAISPAQVLFISFTIYAVSGPVLTLNKLRHHRATRFGNDD